jgi:hypothetical protein
MRYPAGKPIRGLTATRLRRDAGAGLLNVQGAVEAPA